MQGPAPGSRRDFLRGAAGLAAAAAFRDSARADHPRSTPPPRPRPAAKKLAVVTTAYHYLSHAYHVCGRFLYGYLRDGRMHYPDFGIAGMYVAQPQGDLSADLATRFGFTRYPDPAAALTLGGQDLAVDGVLLIGEHGD